MGQYEQQWKQYKRLRIQTVLGYAVAMPISVGLYILSDKLFHGALLGYLLVLPLLIYPATRMTQMQHFPCPRCNNWFFWRAWSENLFAQRCQHCGLRKYSD